MPNSYNSLTELKSNLGITSTTDDAILRSKLESASRSIDSYCNRVFYSYTQTKYFDGSQFLWIPDLLSITSIKTDDDNDGTFENTWTTDDYFTYGVGLEDTINTYPITRLEINPNGDYGSFNSGVKKGVQIIGTWGYGDNTSTPYVVTSVTGSVATVGGLTLTLSADSIIEIGQTILCESEQMYVTALGTLSATVERGVNGTTAAIHSLKTIYVYRYPKDIMQATLDIASALYVNRGRKGLASERIGDYSYTIDQRIVSDVCKDTISKYKRMHI
jgi:uncharacterized UPF0146 family protein